MIHDRPLDDDALLALLRREESAAQAHQDGALGAARLEALAYYDRQPYGDEQEGASQVVTSEFADVIEAMLPGLMRVFAGSDAAAEFAPLAPGQETWAREASAYVPHVLMRQNDGFRLLHGLIKDALMYRLGAVTVDVEEVRETERRLVRSLPRDALDLLAAEAAAEGAELVAEVMPDAPAADELATDGPPFDDGLPFSLPPGTVSGTVSGTLTWVRRRRRVVVANIAPEDVLLSPGARDEDDASFVAYRKRVTASELVALGLSRDDVAALRGGRPPSAEAAARDADGLAEADGRAENGDSERPVWVVVAYLRADVDGDGLSERLRVVYAHDGGGGTGGGRILERAAWDGPVPLVLASPILMSHSLVGRSLFDQTRDLQQVGSVLMRGLLDNLYLANRPRPVVSDQVHFDSLIDWVPGAPIRLKPGALAGDAHVSWLQVPSVAPAALAALEFMATVRENRTGLVRNNQGLEADSLNKTATGMHLLMGAAQQRQELIARVLAETAVKRLYRLVYRAVRRIADGPVRYWSGRGFVGCDPTRWPDELELSVNVGLGTGNRDQALQQLGLIGRLQEKLVALQGGRADGPFVSPVNIATAAHKVTEALGFKTQGLFFRAPDEVARLAAGPAAGAAAPAAAPAGDPATAAALAQIELAREAAAADATIRREKAQADIDIARWKARQWAEIERFKAGLRAGLGDAAAAAEAGR